MKNNIERYFICYDKDRLELLNSNFYFDQNLTTKEAFKMLQAHVYNNSVKVNRGQLKEYCQEYYCKLVTDYEELGNVMTIRYWEE